VVKAVSLPSRKKRGRTEGPKKRTVTTAGGEVGRDERTPTYSTLGGRGGVTEASRMGKNDHLDLGKKKKWAPVK